MAYSLSFIISKQFPSHFPLFSTSNVITAKLFSDRSLLKSSSIIMEISCLPIERIKTVLTSQRYCRLVNKSGPTVCMSGGHSRYHWLPNGSLGTSCGSVLNATAVFFCNSQAIRRFSVWYMLLTLEQFIMWADKLKILHLCKSKPVNVHIKKSAYLLAVWCCKKNLRQRKSISAHLSHHKKLLFKI